MAISFVGATQSSTINGGNITLTMPSMQQNDFAVVAYSVPRAITLAVTTSQTSVSYTAASSIVVNGNLNFQVFKRTQGATVDTQAICTGTGNAQDAIACIAMVWRGVSQASPEDVAETFATGTSSQPDCASITQLSSDAAIVALVASLANTTAVTAPTSYLNLTSTSNSDTRSVATAGSWVLAGSTTAQNPTAYSSFTSAVWTAVTMALRAESTASYLGAQFAYFDALLSEQRRVVVNSY